MALIQRTEIITLDARLKGAAQYITVGAGRTASAEVVSGTIGTAVIGLGRAGPGGTYSDFTSAKAISAVGSLLVAPFSVEGIYELALQVSTRDASAELVAVAVTITEEVA